ncbi:Endonuclease-reverse transcriptase [Operophtera brumata]|uniref:Endonuclease-reverse transcriptase n=1 Tax=Operophtera brumata TaxID=104452 RepID=A0A0L7LRE6_OPEBR|nr:Endonuclease-reverse transcriptase [Operophtera brumata]
MKKRRTSKIIEKHLQVSGSLKRAQKELNTKKNWIPKLKKGHLLKDSRSDILSVATDFYEDLYKSKTSEPTPPELLICEETSENNQNI